MTLQLSQPQVRTIKIQVQGGANSDWYLGTGPRLNDGTGVAIKALHSFVHLLSGGHQLWRVVELCIIHPGRGGGELFCNETDTRQDRKG